MPLLYYNAETARANVEPQNHTIEAPDDLIDFLQNDVLLQEVENGNVTLAMVRPGLETAATVDGTDNEIAEAIEEQITDLGIMAKFAFVFDAAAVNTFYHDAKQGMVTQKARVKLDYASQWDEFEEVMTSGPTTVLLLHSPNGDAVGEWRRQVGHWNIEENRNPATIRGKFGISNYNNLVHGSDAPHSALREIEIIRNCLMR